MPKTRSIMHENVRYRADTHIMIHSNTQTDNYAPHWHTPVELLMPTENHYTAYIANKTYVIQPYEILLIAPNTIHRLEAPSSGHRYFIQADLTILKDVFGISQILSFVSPATHFTPTNSPNIYMQLKKLYLDICSDFFQKIPSGGAGSFAASTLNNLLEPAAYAKLMTMLSLIGRNYIESRTVNVASSGRRQEYINKFMLVCEYIDEHCTEDISLEEVAERTGFSKFHFARLFKEFTSISFYKYVSLKRIETAEDMLRNPHITVTEIAMASGFSNSSAFIRMFRQINGCTPSEFRKMHDTTLELPPEAVPIQE